MIREFFTVKEAASLLRLSVSKVYKEIEAKRLPHYRFGASVRITRKCLDEYIAGCHVDAIASTNDAVPNHLDL